MLGFSPLASEALADSGVPSVVIVSSSVVSISGLGRSINVFSVSSVSFSTLGDFKRQSDIVSSSTLNVLPFSTYFRTLNTNSLSTVDLDYVILNLSRRDKSLTVLVDEQNRSLLIPGSKP